MVSYTMISSFAVLALASSVTCGLVGGFQEADSNSDRVQDVAMKVALTMYANTDNEVMEVKVIKAETQVVAGVNWRLTMEVIFKGDVEKVLCEEVVAFQPLPVNCDSGNSLDCLVVGETQIKKCN